MGCDCGLGHRLWPLTRASQRWGHGGSRILPKPCRPLPHPQLSPGSEEDEAHEGCSRENLGRIQFSVGYNFQESTLTVKIMKAQELPAKDFSGTSDPFVKIYLLPDKKHKLETKVKRKNLNPHWNETFLFEGESSATFPRHGHLLPSTIPLPNHTCGYMHRHICVHTPAGPQMHKHTCKQIHLCAHLHVCTGTDPHTSLAHAHTGNVLARLT